MSTAHRGAEAPTGTPATLTLFLPGAFAKLGDALRESFGAIAPEVELAFHAFIPSGALAREILDGAAADVYVSANVRYMDDLRRAGLVRDSHRLAGNRLCIIVRPDRAHQVTALEDLTRDGVRVVAPQSDTDPCGQYVRAMFERAGLTETMRTKAARGELLHSYGSGDLPAFLTNDRADAGLLYASETLALGESVATVALPRDLDMRDDISFTIGSIIRDGRENPIAKRFVGHLLSPVGQALMVEHGFLPAGTSNDADDKQPVADHGANGSWTDRPNLTG